MQKLTLLVGAIVTALGLYLAGPAHAAAPITVVLDDFDGTYTTLATTIFGPEKANPANWPWTFFGFGPPARGVEETLNLSPSDPTGSAWRYEMANCNTTTTSGMEIAILLAYFNSSFQGETWSPLDDYLDGLTKPPIDWNQPVTFEIDVYGENGAAENTWVQRLSVFDIGSSTLDQTKASLEHLAGNQTGWTTLSLTMTGAPHPNEGNRFGLAVGVDFEIRAGAACLKPNDAACTADNECISNYCDTGSSTCQCPTSESCNFEGPWPNYAIFDYLRVTYTPLRENGQPCDNGGQCISEYCVDGVCCMTGECPEGERCNIEPNPGECTQTLGQGMACTYDDQCTSTFCVDGVCCDTTCAGPTENCNVQGRAGTCFDLAPAAPVLSTTGLLLMVGVLLTLGGLAIRRRGVGRDL